MCNIDSAFICELLHAPVHKRCTPRPALAAQPRGLLVFLDRRAFVLMLLVLLGANLRSGDLNQVIDVSHIDVSF
jgi:hypothetical protein